MTNNVFGYQQLKLHIFLIYQLEIFFIFIVVNIVY